MRRASPWVAALLFTLGCTVALPTAPSPSPSASASTSRASTASVDVGRAFELDRARRHVDYLADPAREGRLSGTKGYRDAATYVASEFRDIGLRPAGDGGTYFQRFQMPLVELTAMPELEVTSPVRRRFELSQDFREIVGGWAGRGTVEAALVFAGGADHGQDRPYGDVDVTGKLVLLFEPRGGAIEGAARAGAAGVLVTTRRTPPLLHFSYIPDFERGAIPAVIVTNDAAERLLAGSGQTFESLADATRSRSGAVAELPLQVRLSVPLGPVRQVEGINVVGLLEGFRKDRHVVVGGHLDGVGRDPDGTLYPAANDNASGVAVTIEVARALAARKESLERSVVFVAFAGEEEGLRGSREFLTHDGPYQRETIRAFVNLDVAGCCGSTLGASQDGTRLIDEVREAGQRQAVTIGVSGGSSDHESFVRAGVPATILTWINSGPIHTPADTAAAIDPRNLTQYGRVATQLAFDLATGD